MKNRSFTFTVEPSEDQMRLDAFLHSHIDDVSRSYIQNMIKEGNVSVSGKVVKKSASPVKAGDEIVCEFETTLERKFDPENIPLSVIFEDDDIIVIDKPSGLVVHPAAGNWSGTLVNALLAHSPQLSKAGGAERAGIVHRLDKGTSGVMVVAKNDSAHRNLSKQFHDREVEKRYLALVFGRMRDIEGIIDTPLGRSMRDRKRISSHTKYAREAKTKWKVIERLGDIFSLLEVRIFTGRTHQIRVHLGEFGHPIVGDMEYGGGRYLSSVKSAKLVEEIKAFPRPALHAWKLSFNHPKTNERLSFEAKIPEDIERLIKACRKSD